MNFACTSLRLTQICQVPRLADTPWYAGCAGKLSAVLRRRKSVFRKQHVPDIRRAMEHHIATPRWGDRFFALSSVW
jgi:hypothetical protein